MLVGKRRQPRYVSRVVGATQPLSFGAVQLLPWRRASQFPSMPAGCCIWLEIWLECEQGGPQGSERLYTAARRLLWLMLAKWLALRCVPLRVTPQGVEASGRAVLLTVTVQWGWLVVPTLNTAGPHRTRPAPRSASTSELPPGYARRARSPGGWRARFPSAERRGECTACMKGLAQALREGALCGRFRRAFPGCPASRPAASPGPR